MVARPRRCLPMWRAMLMGTMASAFGSRDRSEDPGADSGRDRRGSSKDEFMKAGCFKIRRKMPLTKLCDPTRRRRLNQFHGVPGNRLSRQNHRSNKKGSNRTHPYSPVAAGEYSPAAIAVYSPEATGEYSLSATEKYPPAAAGE